MIFKKKKEEQILAPIEPKKIFNLTKVILVLWNGKELEATISSTADIPITEMMKQIIRDGVFDEKNEVIMRVNEIRLKKDKVEEEIETIQEEEEKEEVIN